MNILKKNLFIVFIVLLAGSTMAQNYKLVWEDNFDGNSLDSSIWNIEQTVGIWNTGANAELQHYKKENVGVGDDGEGNNCLILTAKKESYNGYSFTSGKVTTKGKFAFRRGKLEALIKVPDLENGLWPAFWTLGYTPEGWPNCGEIDILEMGHTHAINEGIVNNFIGAHLFWGPADGGFPNYGTEFTTTEDLSTGYFKHTVIWDENTIAVYFNDAETPYFIMGISGDTFNEFQDFQHYILFNLAVGGAFTGIYNLDGITANIPANMYVDWVKLYQEEGKEDLESNLAIFDEFGVYEDESTADMRMDLGYDLFENTTGLNTLTGSTAFEGNNVLAYNTTAGQAYELKLTAGLTRNMSTYNAGSLQLYIKTDLQNDISIGLADTNGKEKFTVFNSDNENNFKRDGSWQLAYLNLADFDADINLASLKEMLIVKGNAASDGYILIDQVMFKQSVPAKGFYNILTDDPNISEGFIVDGVNYNMYIWNNTVTFNEYFAAYEGENVHSFRSSGAEAWFGFGFHSENSLNFSAYENGYLNISIRTNDNNAFYIGMDDKNNGSGVIDFTGNNDPYGFQRNGEWQHLNIPIADLTAAGMDLSSINHVFKTGGASIGNIAFDNIFLSEDLPTLENPMVCYTESISVNPSGKTIEPGKRQVFTADVHNQFGNAHDNNVEWTTDGGTINENGVFYSDTEGEFTITASQDGKTASATISVEIASGIELSDKAKVDAFIVNEVLTVTGMTEPYSIKVFNSAGQIIESAQYVSNANINLANKSNGVYIINIQSENINSSFKVIK